jgi:hypothetical protein
MVETFHLVPADECDSVTVEPAPAEPPSGVDLPIDPLAQTVAATHPPEFVLPAAPQADQPGLPDSNSVAENALEPDSATSATRRFVPVRPGELDQSLPERTAGSWISPQTWALVVGLLAVGLLAWYMLQPPTADALYRRIQRETAGSSDEAPPQTEEDIRQFLDRFADDPRSSEVKDYAERIEITRLEHRLERHSKGLQTQASLLPVEQSYLDAMNTARSDPEAGIARLQAIIDLFESPTETSGPIGRCVALARQRLSELRKQFESQTQEQLATVEQRLDRADELRKTAPQRAAAIYRAVIELYGGKNWAKSVVSRARSALEKTK